MQHLWHWQMQAMIIDERGIVLNPGSFTQIRFLAIRSNSLGLQTDSI